MPTDSNDTSSRRGFIAAAGASLVAAGLSSLTRAEDVPLDPPNKEGPDLQVPTAQKKTGWALVGLGELCLDQVLPAIMQTQHCQAGGARQWSRRQGEESRRCVRDRSRRRFTITTISTRSRTTPRSTLSTSFCRTRCTLSSRCARFNRRQARLLRKTNGEDVARMSADDRCGESGRHKS